MDATIIDAPLSTKNKARARDPEMSSTKKGNDWFFGMKAHIGVDAGSGVTHSLDTSTARLHDSQVRDALLHGNETSVWADTEFKRFRYTVREIAMHNYLPDYEVRFDEARDMAVLLGRGTVVAVKSAVYLRPAS